MDSYRDLDNKIEETLGSLDKVERAGPGHFFYTRVQARLSRSHKTAWDHVTAYLAKPAIAAAIIGIVITSNVVALFRESSRDTGISSDMPDLSLVDDYSRQFVSFYDPENAEP